MYNTPSTHTTSSARPPMNFGDIATYFRTRYGSDPSLKIALDALSLHAITASDVIHSDSAARLADEVNERASNTLGGTMSLEDAYTIIHGASTSPEDQPYFERLAHFVH